MADAPQPVADTTPQAGTIIRGARRGYLLGSVVVIAVSLLCIGAFFSLLINPQQDPGVRVWLLNHAPDQIAIIDPYQGNAEKTFGVADGLRSLTFSRDGKLVYVENVVDETNKINVLNAATYLREDSLETDGIPQGMAVFPDDNRVAVILGSRTDFMAGGFDVLDLKHRSKADPTKRLDLMRVRDLQLTHKIAIGDDANRIYMVDAKSSKLFVYSFRERKEIKAIELGGACEDFIYPEQGSYYFASVLQHLTVYQINKATDEIVAGYVFSDMDPQAPYRKGFIRKLAVDRTGRYLYGVCDDRKAIAIWDLNNPEYIVDPRVFVGDPSHAGFPRLTEFPTYLPMARFRVKGGYKPGETYVPNPNLVATDPLDQYVYVVDEDGALYIYDRLKVQVRQPLEYHETASIPTPDPLRIVLTLASGTTEVRDIAVSKPHARVEPAAPVAEGGP